MSAGAYGYAKVCLDEAIAYARERHTFGKPLIANQVVRHRLVDMAMRINAVKSTLELLAWRVGQGEKPVAEICMLKNLATSTLEFCANEAMQVFGGAGYLRGVEGRAHLSRDQGDVDRRRLGRDHEGPRGAADGAVAAGCAMAPCPKHMLATVRRARCDVPAMVLRHHPAQQGARPQGRRRRARAGLDAARVARGSRRQSGDRRAGGRAADRDARQLLRHVGRDHADGAEALRDARPAHRLRQAGRARQGGDRRGRVLPHHALGRLHPRLRASRRSQGSRSPPRPAPSCSAPRAR